ncbi:Small lysine-rich protein 1 [Taenia solium]|eukprot:TsM_000898200 transcript=TsM_000898200 gene=TsM_000898200
MVEPIVQASVYNALRADQHIYLITTALLNITTLAPKAKNVPNPKKKGKTRKRASPKLSSANKPPPDILDPPAMENLDLIAHNAPEALAYRNYRWQGNKKKKKG